MTRLSDQQINEASEARSEGTSAPAPSPDALNDLERTCRAADATR